MHVASTPTTIHDLDALGAQVDLSLLYVDDHLIVVNKQVGLSTIPGNTLVKGEGTDEASSIEVKPPVPLESSTADAVMLTSLLALDEDLKQYSAVSAQPALAQGNDTTSSSPPLAAPPFPATSPSSPSPPRPNNKRKRTHQELWMDMLTEDPVTLQHTLNLSADPYLARTLASLLAHKSSVPRKRHIFVEWGVRILKAPSDVMETIYERLLKAFEAKEGNRQDSVQTRLLRVFQQVKTVHRLDCETSGALVLARTVQAARSLSAQFREKKVGKRYVALVKGCPLWPQPRGEVCLPIRSDRETRPKQVMDPERGKESKTLFRTVCVGTAAGCDGTVERITRVELTPLTGRTHQLRVHMAALGHPILGDSIYSMGDKWTKSDMRAFVKPYLTEDDRLEEEDVEGRKEEGMKEGCVLEVKERTLETRGARLHLHAEILSFHHPISGERIRFEARAPF